MTPVNRFLACKYITAKEPTLGEFTIGVPLDMSQGGGGRGRAGGGSDERRAAGFGGCSGG